MNWDAISAIGQVLGSVGVIITLAYLSIQVRHARDEVRRSISHDRLDSIRGLDMNRMSNERLISVAMKAHTALGYTPSAFQKTLMESAGLTLEDVALLQTDMMVFWECHSEIIPYAEQMRDSERSTFDILLRGTYGSPLGSLWYQSSKQRLDQDAVCYVDKLLVQSA